MADVTISYKGADIATMSATGVKTLLTGAQYCEDDITVSYTKPTPSLEAKTNVSPTTSSQTITPSAGYDGLASVQINAMPSGSATTPATTITANPTISVSNGGLITASVSKTQAVTPTVSAGYVANGTAGTVTVSGSNTSQLTAKAAATYTPTTSNQTIAAGQYLTGAQTISGDANLIAGNIKDGVTIFGVTGDYQGGGGVNYVTITWEQMMAIVDSMYYPNNATVVTDPDTPWITTITLPENSLICGRGSQSLNPSVSGLTYDKFQMGGRSPFGYMFVFYVGTTNGTITA